MAIDQKQIRSEKLELILRRKVRPGDPSMVRNIVLSSGLFNKEEINIAAELVEERLSKGLRSGYFFLFAEQEGKTVGYSCFGPIGGTESSFDLYWIAVHASQQGQGVGRTILMESEKEIKIKGGRRIYVETSSLKSYDPTRRFYEVAGYKKEALLKDFYAPGNHKVIYVKKL